MNIVSRVQQKIKSFDFSWMIPTGFGISCALLTAGIVMLMLRGFGNMENGWIFSIGADLFCLAISVMLSFSCVLNYKSRNEHTRVFVILLTVSAFSLFLDETTWLFQAIAPLRGINHVVYVLVEGAAAVPAFPSDSLHRLHLPGRCLFRRCSYARSTFSIRFTLRLTKTAFARAPTNGT